MKFVLASEPDHVGEWVYPGTWSDLETPAQNFFESSLIERSAFSALWAVLDAKTPGEEALLGGCLPDAGYPHNEPDAYDEINPALLECLLAVPVHERWLIAKAWATELAGRPPNKERLTAFKQLLNQLCKLAAQRGDQMLVILPLR